MSFTFEKSLINLVIPDLPLVIEKTHQELCQGSTIIQSSDGNIFCIRCALKILQIPDQLRIRKKQILQSFHKIGVSGNEELLVSDEYFVKGFCIFFVSELAFPNSDLFNLITEFALILFISPTHLNWLFQQIYIQIHSHLEGSKQILQFLGTFLSNTRKIQYFIQNQEAFFDFLVHSGLNLDLEENIISSVIYILCKLASSADSLFLFSKWVTLIPSDLCKILSNFTTDHLNRNIIGLIMILFNESATTFIPAFLEAGVFEALKRLILSNQMELKLSALIIIEKCLNYLNQEGKEIGCIDLTEFLIESLSGTINPQILVLIFHSLQHLINLGSDRHVFTSGKQLILDTLLYCITQEYWETTLSGIYLLRGLINQIPDFPLVEAKFCNLIEIIFSKKFVNWTIKIETMHLIKELKKIQPFADTAGFFSKLFESISYIEETNSSHMKFFATLLQTLIDISIFGNSSFLSFLIEQFSLFFVEWFLPNKTHHWDENLVVLFFQLTSKILFTCNREKNSSMKRFCGYLIQKKVFDLVWWSLKKNSIQYLQALSWLTLWNLLHAVDLISVEFFTQCKYLVLLNSTSNNIELVEKISFLDMNLLKYSVDPYYKKWQISLIAFLACSTFCQNCFVDTRVKYESLDSFLDSLTQIEDLPNESFNHILYLLSVRTKQKASSNCFEREISSHSGSIIQAIKKKNLLLSEFTFGMFQTFSSNIIFFLWNQSCLLEYNLAILVKYFEKKENITEELSNWKELIEFNSHLAAKILSLVFSKLETRNAILNLLILIDVSMDPSVSEDDFVLALTTQGIIDTIITCFNSKYINEEDLQCMKLRVLFRISNSLSEMHLQSYLPSFFSLLPINVAETPPKIILSIFNLFNSLGSKMKKLNLTPNQSKVVWNFLLNAFKLFETNESNISPCLILFFILMKNNEKGNIPTDCSITIEKLLKLLNQTKFPLLKVISGRSISSFGVEFFSWEISRRMWLSSLSDLLDMNEIVQAGAVCNLKTLIQHSPMQKKCLELGWNKFVIHTFYNYEFLTVPQLKFLLLIAETSNIEKKEFFHLTSLTSILHLFVLQCCSISSNIPLIMVFLFSQFFVQVFSLLDIKLKELLTKVGNKIKLQLQQQPQKFTHNTEKFAYKIVDGIFVPLNVLIVLEEEVNQISHIQVLEEIEKLIKLCNRKS